MLGQGPDKVQATFNDASVCFSEEEWMILKEWQKELYRNVMNEIHQALLSLGPLIVTTVFSLRTKDKEGLGIPGCQEAESIQDGAPASMFTDDLGAEVRRRSLDPDPGEGICNREELINRNKEETLNSEITWKTERRERKDCLSTGYEMILSCIKEDAAAYSCAVDQNSERQQNPSTSTGFCIKEDEATYCNDEQDSARQHSASISQGHGVITTINTLYDKDEADNYSMEHNEAGIGDRAWSPAAVSSDSDTAQKASQSALASTQATATTQEDAAGSSAPLATLPATTDVRPTTTNFPTVSTLPESRQVPREPIMATQHNTKGSSTAEGAACSDNSAPQEHSETGPQGEMPTLEDLGSFHELEFSATSLGSPMRSPTPSMAELNARMQRMEEQQATLTQLVERQLEESRLQRESYSASVRHLSRSIGRFASTIVTLARHVREGNDHTSRLVEAMLVGQQANLARMPSIPDSAQSNTTTPSSSTTASPRRRASRLTGPSGKVAQAQKCTRK
ncbi:uncharacterized protein [Ambystoma mexicanum]|uniref:uncharacterized protein isoform X1 n=1 Tax=Ambystoma mexicanum TaxID=8296 RepID=UPI0037E8B22A